MASQEAASEDIKQDNTYLDFKAELKKKRESRKLIHSCKQWEYKGTSDSVLRHKKTKHEGVRFPCDQCDKTFSKRASLNHHINSNHKRIKENIKQICLDEYLCDICDFKGKGL